MTKESVAAVPGVPVEAEQVEVVAKAIANVRWPDLTWEYIVEHTGEGAESFRREAAAVLPSLREVIAAEVLGPVRELVSDWNANGNSRELGDPAAHVWHEAARQLLDLLPAPVQAAEEVGGDA